MLIIIKKHTNFSTSISKGTASKMTLGPIVLIASNNALSNSSLNIKPSLSRRFTTDRRFWKNKNYSIKMILRSA